ncbi:MAG: alpha-1,4-glucan--maltose-1-phosphate maltosyltransferase [Acidimicrobiia bacterium]|nr:alpha-1,4-glucan--maltose-1-phosphate maltosyltransferase [Acidimicrobiia bacterium]
MPLARIEIQDIRPRTPTGHPAKGSVGERIPISADILRDGHDHLAARLRWRAKGQRGWQVRPMAPAGNDRYQGWFEPTSVGPHEVVIEAWTDRFGTWREHTEKRAAAASPDLEVELLVGAELLEQLAPQAPKADRPRLLDTAATLRSTTCTERVKLDAGLDEHLGRLLEAVADPTDLTPSKPVAVWVDRERARFSAWYELFPRSEGGFAGAAKRLGSIADMGFDVVYLPPIHPIGVTHRKGRDNTLTPSATDPGSPWAIGGPAGGHDAIAPELGTIEDFRAFREEAESLGMEVALDYALQCSPDHPWVGEHPEWFRRRPDGSIRYAENPPKKYQDIHPIEFWPEQDSDRVALWNACRDVLEHWIAEGIRIFRVDNPHTKPFAFWEWVIADVVSRHPDVLFLAEAFTRPRVMHSLAAVGFSQSYTYFTWRTAAWELREYGEELAQGPGADYFRPNFWPNTPDILSGPLRDGPPSAFRLRAVLAATMSPNWGVYSGYEHVENQPASPTNEEYLHSEKYEIRKRDWAQGGEWQGATVDLTQFIGLLNRARRNHPALAELRTLRFHSSTNDEQAVVYSKTAADGTDPVLVVVNVDPVNAFKGLLRLDLAELGLSGSTPYEVHDELTGERFTWTGAEPYIELDPAVGREAHVFTLRTLTT